jgi:hypothetical protein
VGNNGLLFQNKETSKRIYRTHGRNTTESNGRPEVEMGNVAKQIIEEEGSRKTPLFFLSMNISIVIQNYFFKIFFLHISYDNTKNVLSYKIIRQPKEPEGFV